VRLSIQGIALTLVLLAGLQTSWAQGAPAPQQAASTPQNTMAQRMQACVVCHGKEGRATNQGYFPRIAGKPAGYLFNQLKNFQAGLRHYAAMNHLVQNLSDDYLRDIARYFSGLDLPYPPAQVTRLTPQEERTAQTLVFKGAPDRGIPACVSCHGQQMAGMLPAMPGLLTLPSDYLSAQLGAWRTDQRHAKAPDCMAKVAKALAPEEVSVLARWLSAQTLPTGTHPAAASSQPLPVACGSFIQ
jgi:cytochrome c553